VQKNTGAFIDLKEIILHQNNPNRKVIMRVEDNLILIRTFPLKEHSGHRSKEIRVKRFIVLDDLFFEGLALWRGEGSKSKGLYFGNSDPSLLHRFLEFAEHKLGIDRKKFKVTINVPTLLDPDKVKEKWANELSIPVRNFTRVCGDPRIRKEYSQVYFNSVILAKLMDDLYSRSKAFILHNRRASVAFLRGIFAAEGSVLVKNSGVLHHITFSSKDSELIQFLEQCLCLNGVKPSKYMINGMNLQIYGLSNFKHVRKLGIHTLHPEKREKFEQGFANYKRVNVLHGEEARALILQRLASGPKTYDDLAAALGKARTTIQAHHIPILEKRGLVKRAGKRGQAWMWVLAEPKHLAPL